MTNEQIATQKMAEITNKMAKLQERLANVPEDKMWQYAGDLGYINSQLEELMSFTIGMEVNN